MSLDKLPILTTPVHYSKTNTRVQLYFNIKCTLQQELHYVFLFTVE